jgi:hypothetical protein
MPAFQAAFRKEQNVKLNFRAFFSVIIAMLCILSITGYAHETDSEHTNTRTMGSPIHSHVMLPVSSLTASSADEYLAAYASATTYVTEASFYDEEEGGGGLTEWCNSCIGVHPNAPVGCHISCPVGGSHSHNNCCSGATCPCINPGSLGCGHAPNIPQ